MGISGVRNRAALVVLIGAALGAGLFRAADVAASTKGRALPAAKPAAAAPVEVAPKVSLVRDDLIVGRAAERETTSGGSLVAFVAEGDLKIFDTRTGKTKTILDNNPENEWASWPKILDDRTLSFVSRKGIETIEVADGSRTLVVSIPEDRYVAAYAWSPDRGTVAYLIVEPVNEGAAYRPFLRQVNVATGAMTETVIDSLMPEGVCGDGGVNERLVSFSPDGSLIAVEDTMLQGGKTVFFVDRSGSLVGKPLNGIFPRWAPGVSDAVFVRDIIANAWYRYEPKTGVRTAAPIPSTAMRVRVSPDGTTIAYDDGKVLTGLYVRNLATGETERIARRAAHPVWMSDSSVAAVGTQPCLDCGEGSEVWWENGKTYEYSRDGRERRLPMSWTSDIDVLFV